MSHKVCVKLAPVLTADRWGDPKWTRPGRTFYWGGSLKLLPGKPTPLIVDHDMSRVVGTVDELFTMPWPDGPWIMARGVVDDPPGWLRQNQTKASFGRWDVHATTHPDGWERVTRALVREVSLLRDLEAAEPLAEVVLLKRSPAGTTTSGPAGAAPHTGSVVIAGNGQLLQRPNIGEVLGVR